MQNLVVFIEPSDDASNISSKAAILYLNRFCIDEESACELSGVYYLKSEEPLNFTLKQKEEGKGEGILSYLTGLIHGVLNSRGTDGVSYAIKLSTELKI